MRGYFAFFLVFLSSALLLSLLSLSEAAQTADLSRAVAVSRSYGVEMNAKEAVLEAARGGSLAGFAAYDLSHDVSTCSHCEDHFCSPLLPLGPNSCDSALCSLCFRESGAREAAIGGALARLRMLRAHAFDQDFEVAIGSADFEVFLRPEKAAKNGYAVDYGRFRKAVRIAVSSEKFGIKREGVIPAGTVLR